MCTDHPPSPSTKPSDPAPTAALSAGPVVGAGEALPATYGGPGYTRRAAPHEDDVSEGVWWAKVGQLDEHGPLLRCMLSWPSPSLDAVDDPEAAHMLARPDRAAMRGEISALAELYAEEGVEVWMAEPALSGLGVAPPNFLFLRDLGLSTPEGVVLGRPAAPVRAGEPVFMQAALAARGVPCLALPRGGATFEGADALWLDRHTLLVGVGRRTNAEGCAQLASLLWARGVEVLGLPLPVGVQHLLGVCLLLDADLAMIDAERCPPSLRALLKHRGLRLIELQPSAELRRGVANNGVVLRPRELVIPAGNPETEALLRAEGLRVLSRPMGACLAAAGAMGCMTATLLRSPGR